MTYSVLAQLWQTLGRKNSLSSRQFHAQHSLNVMMRREKSEKTGYKTIVVKHLVDPEYLHQTVNIMNQHFDVQNSTIFETNPGRGRLSACLMNHSAQQVYGFEPKALYSNDLECLEKEFTGRFQHVKGNLYTVEPDQCKPQSWDKECMVRVVGSLPMDRLQFIVTSWVENLSRKRNIFSHGRVEQYVFVSAAEVALIKEGQSALAEDRAFSSTNKYRKPYRAILYPFFFDIDVLLCVPGSCFDHQDGEAKQQKQAEDSYLIKIVPKLDVQDLERLPEFAGFVKHLMPRLNYQTRLVPSVESLIPGMGLWMLNEGYTMLQNGYHFKIKDYWRLFQAILDHPTVDLPAFSERPNKRD